MITSGLILRWQVYWRRIDHRNARTIHHYRSHLQAGDGATISSCNFELQAAHFPTMSGITADDVGIAGSLLEVIYPLPAPDPPDSQQFAPAGGAGWGSTFLQWWGTRCLLNTAVERRRYDPWVVLPFTGIDAVEDKSIPTITAAYATAVDGVAVQLSTDVQAFGPTPGDQITLTPILWTRHDQSWRDVIGGNADIRMRHVRRRNVYWRELDFPP